MADLPRVPRRLVTTQAPRSSVSGSDVAASAATVGRALGEFGAAWETALLPQTEGQGAKSVVRNPDGTLGVRLLPEWTRTDAAFNRGASIAYLSELGGEVRNHLTSLRSRFEGDLDGMKQAFGEYSEDLVSRQQPAIAASVRKMVDAESQRLYDGAQSDFETRQRQIFADRIGVEMGRIEDELSSLARAGGAGTPDYQEKLDDWIALANETATNPVFKASPEKVEMTRRHLEARLLTETVRHEVETRFRDDPAAARRYAEETLNDPGLAMSAEERRKAIGDAMSWHDKLSAEVRQARTEYREEARRVISALRDTDAFVAPEDIADLLAEGRELRDSAYVRRIEDAARLRDLRSGFRAMPAGRDKLNVYDSATGTVAVDAPPEFAPLFQTAGEKHGIPAGLLAAQARAESAFNPNAVSPAGAVGISQFMPGTAKRFGIDPRVPEQAIDAQAQYMRILLDRYDGDVGLALAGYNWGEGNVDRWLKAGGDPARLPRETRDYIARILGTEPSRQYDPAIIKAYRTELSSDLTGMIADAKDVIGREWGLDADTASLLVDYARAVNDPAKTREVLDILDESALHAGVNGMTGAERMAFRNMLLDPNGPIGDDAVRARLVAAEERNRAHRDKLLAEDPLRYGIEQGWFKGDDPLDFANPDALAANLGSRAQKIAIVGQHEGGEARSVLYPEEVENLTRWWGTATPDDKIALAASFADTLDADTLDATLGDLAEKPEAETLALAAGLYQTNPEAATGVIRGQALLAENKMLAPQRDEGTKEAWRSATVEAVPLDAVVLDGARNRIFASAWYRYADLSRQARDESGEFDRGRFDQAVADITGGMVWLNGRQTPAPSYGMTQRQFDAHWRALPESAFAGAVAFDGSPVTADAMRGQARLSMIERGKYAVEIGGGYVLDATGAPFVLDLGETVNREAKGDFGGLPSIVPGIGASERAMLQPPRSDEPPLMQEIGR